MIVFIHSAGLEQNSGIYTDVKLNEKRYLGHRNVGYVGWCRSYRFLEASRITSGFDVRFSLKKEYP